jgi:hypothetical protein
MFRGLESRSMRWARHASRKWEVQCTLVQALRLCTGRTAHRGSRGIALLIHDHSTRRGRSLSPGKIRYPLYRRLGGPQDRFGQVRKISPSPGFDPRTVEPVASRYTDWATGPHASRRGRDYRCVRNVSRHTSVDCYMGYVMGARILIGSVRVRARTNDGQLLTRYCISQLDKTGTSYEIPSNCASWN